MIDRKDILIALPAFNEATVIHDVITDIKAHGYTNIMVVDDGSTDNTTDTIKDITKHNLRLCINCGVGAATRAAILATRALGYQYLIFIDADGQHYADDIDVVVNEMDKSKADMVIGSRFIARQKGIPKMRRFYNLIANVITNAGRFTVTDSQSGFRMLNRKAIENIHLEIDDYGVCTEMIWKCNVSKLNISEAPIKVRYTEYSMSKGQNFWKGVKTGISLMKNK